MRSSEALSPVAVFRTLLEFQFFSISDSEERSRILKDFATREFNAILWIFLIATTCLLLTKLVSLFSLWSKAKLIPGPPHSSFFYGHSKLISRENLNELLADYHNNYGSVIKLWLGPTQLLVSIKEPEIIKEILLKAEDKLPLTGKAFRLAFGELSLFVSSFVEIYSEIRMAQKVSMHDKQQNVSKMPFLLASIYESARLLPTGPLLQRCSLKKDLILKTGITIPAGTVLVVPVQLIQTDDSTWGTDAEEFNPYRFLSSSGQAYSMEFKNPCPAVGRHEDSGERSFVLNEPIGSNAFLSFGSGSRACIGQKLAIQGVATLLTSLIEKYEIRPASGSNSDLKPAMSNRSPLSSPKIVFVRRTAEDTIKT